MIPFCHRPAKDAKQKRENALRNNFIQFNMATISYNLNLAVYACACGNPLTKGLEARIRNTLGSRNLDLPAKI